MRDIKIGKYYAAESDIHKMSSTYKFISLFIFLILIFLVKDFIVLAILYAFVFSLILISNIEIILYLKTIKTIWVFLIFVLLINIIFNASIEMAFISSFKLILLVLYSSIITFTTTPKDMTKGLETLLYPFRRFVNIKKMSLTISLSIRFIPVIFEQSYKIVKSQKSRGLDIQSVNIKEKLYAINSIILPIFILSFKRSDEIADFLELRLYNLNTRIENRIYSNNQFDNLILISHILLIIIYLFKEVI